MEFAPQAFSHNSKTLDFIPSAPLSLIIVDKRLLDAHVHMALWYSYVTALEYHSQYDSLVFTKYSSLRIGNMQIQRNGCQTLFKLKDPTSLELTLIKV